MSKFVGDYLSLQSGEVFAFDRHLDNGRKSRTKTFSTVFRHIASLNWGSSGTNQIYASKMMNVYLIRLLKSKSYIQKHNLLMNFYDVRS